MKSYFGKIVIGEIRNPNSLSSTKKNSDTLFIPFNESNIRFVHYPDCQQLIIWLTHPGIEYGTIRLVNRKSGKNEEELAVADRLSGSIQIVWDTLHIAPGLYTIEIEWKNGWMHQIDFEKFKKGQTRVSDNKAAGINKEINEKAESAGPIVYRDGFGNILENEDLVLREKINKDMVRRFSRRIEYTGNARSGTVIYIDNKTRLDFYYEMGGGNCMVYIDVPTEEKWEQLTNTPVSSRREILEFTAATVQTQQASNCYYEIQSNAIIFYYKKE